MNIFSAYSDVDAFFKSKPLISDFDGTKRFPSRSLCLDIYLFLALPITRSVLKNSFFISNLGLYSSGIFAHLP